MRMPELSRVLVAAGTLWLGSVPSVRAESEAERAVTQPGGGFQYPAPSVPSNTAVWVSAREGDASSSVLLTDEDGSVVPWSEQSISSPLEDAGWDMRFQPSAPLRVGVTYRVSVGAEAETVSQFTVTEPADAVLPAVPTILDHNYFADRGELSIDVDNPEAWTLLQLGEVADLGGDDETSATHASEQSIFSKPVPALSTVYFRVAAVDLAGNFSGWSAISVVVTPERGHGDDATDEPSGGAGCNAGGQRNPAPVALILLLVIAGRRRRTGPRVSTERSPNRPPESG